MEIHEYIIYLFDVFILGTLFMIMWKQITTNKYIL